MRVRAGPFTGRTGERWARADRTAARRLNGRRALTTRLASTVDAGQVAEVLLEVGLPALGAGAATVIAHDETHPAAPARVLATRGPPAPVAGTAPGPHRSPLVREVVSSRGPDGR